MLPRRMCLGLTFFDDVVLDHWLLSAMVLNVRNRLALTLMVRFYRIKLICHVG